MNYVIGIDGGGTKTHAVLLDNHGRVVAAAVGGTTNYQTVGLKAAVCQILHLIDRLMKDSQLHLEQIIHIVCSLAGIDSEQDQRVMESELEQSLRRGIQVFNDGLAALYSVNGSGEGAILVAGTGSLAMGKDMNGKLIRVGGWGHLVGDLGSGFDIGRRAIAAVLAVAEEIAPRTMLSQKILDFLDVTNASQLIAWASAHDRSPNQFAALVPVVVQCAELGDQVAIRILADAARELGKLANLVLRKGTWRQKQLSLIGGVERNWKWIGPVLMSEVEREHPGVKWVKPLYLPVIGAALMAFEQAGIRLGREIEHLQRFQMEDS